MGGITMNNIDRIVLPKKIQEKMIEFFCCTKKFDKISKLRFYTLLRMTRLAKVIYFTKNDLIDN